LTAAAYLLFAFPAVALEATTEELVGQASSLAIDYQEDFKVNHPNFF